MSRLLTVGLSVTFAFLVVGVLLCRPSYAAGPPDDRVAPWVDADCHWLRFDSQAANWQEVDENDGATTSDNVYFTAPPLNVWVQDAYGSRTADGDWNGPYTGASAYMRMHMRALVGGGLQHGTVKGQYKRGTSVIWVEVINTSVVPTQYTSYYSAHQSANWTENDAEMSGLKIWGKMTGPAGGGVMRVDEVDLEFFAD